MESWLSPVNVPGPAAPDPLETTFHALFSCDLSEVSLLSGGAQSVPEAVAAELVTPSSSRVGRRDLGPVT